MSFSWSQGLFRLNIPYIDFLENGVFIYSVKAFTDYLKIFYAERIVSFWQRFATFMRGDLLEDLGELKRK